MKKYDSGLINIVYMAVILSTVTEKAAGAGRGYTCPFAALKNGVTTMRSAGRKATFKCRAGYDLFGPANSDCDGSKWSPPLPVCVKTGCSTITAVRNGIIYQESNNGAVIKFRCDPGYYPTSFPVVFCNGTQWNFTQPECKADYSSSQTWCDFEPVDLCGWLQQDWNNDTYMWRRHHGVTPSRVVETGPLFDHTLGPGRQGQYMYIESSSGQAGDSAWLYTAPYSAALSLNASVCFWYHMYGATTGTLKVFVKPEGMYLEHLKPIFEKEGHQEDAWLLGFFHVEETDKPFQIVFEGVHGHGYTSDIAIDDVTLVKGSCADQNTRKSYDKGGEQAGRSGAAGGGGLPPGAVAVLVLVGGGVLAAVVAAAAFLIVRWRRRGEVGKWEAAPDDNYVRYMSHEEALVQEDSDSSDAPGVM